MSTAVPAFLRISLTRLQSACLIACLALIVVVLSGASAPQAVRAHAELVAADPPPDGLLAAPPVRLELRFREAVDAGAGSPGVRLLDRQGNELEIRRVEVDSGDQRLVTADFPDLGPGTYTLVWTTRSAVDGHTISGTYAFRVGGGGAPGAATVEGERPAGWAVLTRWLSFLGAAVAIGMFAVARFVTPTSPPARRLRLIAVIGAVVALAATASEPLLALVDPPLGDRDPTLAETLRSLPDAWVLRPVGLVMTLVVSLIWLKARTTLRVGVEWTGLAAPLLAILGLSLTGHSAATEGVLRPVAIGANIVHQWSVALWVGGLVGLAIARRSVTEDDTVDPIRRFSRFALGLFGVAVVTGVITSGIILPAVSALWDSVYGWIILIKIIVLLPVIALATYHRLALRRRSTWATGALRRTVRLETAGVAVVLLVASTLALNAPPLSRAVRGGEVATLTLSALVDLQADEQAVLHLSLDPAEPGAPNELRVALEDLTGQPIRLAETTRVLLAFESLIDPEVSRTATAATPDESGGWMIDGLELSLDSWWRISVTIREAGAPDLTTPFYVLLPDPNLRGFDAPRIPDSDPVAAALFTQTKARFAAAQSYHVDQLLGSGQGAVLESQETLVAPNGGKPAAYQALTADAGIIRVDGREWIRVAGEWRERGAGPIVPPSDIVEEYDGATGIRFGHVEEVNGERSQMILFYSPGRQGLAPAWYIWWIGVESGELHKEVMVSRAHYMTKVYTGWNADFVIEPPVADTPATPVLTD